MWCNHIIAIYKSYKNTQKLKKYDFSTLHEVVRPVRSVKYFQFNGSYCVVLAEVPVAQTGSRLRN